MPRYVNDAMNRLMMLHFTRAEPAFSYFEATRVYIDAFCVNSSSAKGRVERARLTLQDRLIKELRLRGISTVANANAYAPSFIAM